MLTYADVWYVDVCGRMRTYADEENEDPESQAKVSETAHTTICMRPSATIENEDHKVV